MVLLALLVVTSTHFVSARVQGAGRPRHRPHPHRSLRPRQNLPPPAAGRGAARDIRAVCGGCDDSQHIPVLFNARIGTKGKSLLEIKERFMPIEEATTKL